MSDTPNTKNSLRKEITVVIIVKLIALTVLWQVCFTDPPGKYITTQKLSQRILD